MTYLRWLRYLIDVTLRDKRYVVLNVDETSVNALVQTGHGYVSHGAQRRGRGHRRRFHPIDRTDIKTTLMGVICDQSGLQPYLPQVFMPKYTQNAHPPLWARAQYARQGFPFQYWHGTSGGTTPFTFKQWANALRSAVHSFDPDIWILMIMDCCSSHLDLRTANHLARLGFLTAIIPAKLTWLLQPLDVYVYADLKRVLRQLLAERTHRPLEEVDVAGAWITPTAAAVKAVVVQTDWTDHFARLGAGLGVEPLRDELRRYVQDEALHPALPRLRDFATMINRVQHAEGTRSLHQALMQPAIRIRDLGPEHAPPRGARLELPDLAPAAKRLRKDAIPDGGFNDILRRHLVRHRVADPLGGVVGPEATRIFLPRLDAPA